MTEMYSPSFCRWPAVLHRYYRQWKLPGPEVVRAASVPVLLICGEADALSPAEEHAKPLKQCIGSNARDVFVVPEAAHQVSCGT